MNLASGGEGKERFGIEQRPAFKPDVPHVFHLILPNTVWVSFIIPILQIGLLSLRSIPAISFV